MRPLPACVASSGTTDCAAIDAHRRGCARDVAPPRSRTGVDGAATARTSKPPPNVSVSSQAFMNETETIVPTTSVKTTSVNIASVTPVRNRFRSG